MNAGLVHFWWKPCPKNDSTRGGALAPSSQL